MFYFVIKILYTSQYGLVLDNYSDPKTRCPIYSIYCIIDDNNRKNIHHYIENIFGTKIGGLPAIFTIKTYLFASLLYWFDKFNATNKSTKMVTKIMLGMGRKFEINFQMLKE